MHGIKKIILLTEARVTYVVQQYTDDKISEIIQAVNARTVRAYLIAHKYYNDIRSA